MLLNTLLSNSFNPHDSPKSPDSRAHFSLFRQMWSQVLESPAQARGVGGVGRACADEAAFKEIFFFLYRFGNCS